MWVVVCVSGVGDEGRGVGGCGWVWMGGVGEEGGHCSNNALHRDVPRAKCACATSHRAQDDYNNTMQNGKLEKVDEGILCVPPPFGASALLAVRRPQ